MERQFWDGRDQDLEAQAHGPMQAEPEMAISKEMAVKRISSMAGYQEQFKKAFNEDNITFKKIADAIVTFLKALDGELPTIIYPKLPAVTATTPKPDMK